MGIVTSRSDALQGVDPSKLAPRAQTAAALLKAFGHEGRLMILCHLATGEKSVTELEQLLDTRQAAVSQQLARLRMEGLVEPRREGKAIYYSLVPGEMEHYVLAICKLFATE
ncbi:ArsR family transcriptional regulator [Haematobacter massiliensis]|uniref:ArsR family transcriptional regulator n=1 Tax=Haematobacter massiliensis TaxID=195105 RepID=A0A086YBK3_9RHOB|nr:ArsR family transcriptional regulator [Haematobacter massiliensis]